MRKARRALWMMLLPFAFGCATTPAGEVRDPERQLGFGLAALARQDFSAAFEHLVWVYSTHWDRPIGQRALLALAAAELDPRNPARRLGVGSRLAASYLQLVPHHGWVDPAASTMYLLALELGAAEQRATDAEAERQAAVAEAAKAQAAARQAEQAARRAQSQARDARSTQGNQPAPGRDLPTLPGPPVTAQIRQLQQRVEQLQREVAERDQELERMRRTLRH